MEIGIKEQVRNWLLEEAEPSYQSFALSLLPNVDNVIGVRIPKLRKKAKQLLKQWEKKDIILYLYERGELYFEEVMIKGFVIGEIKVTTDERICLIKQHIERISNWSLCDSFCSSLKEAKKEKQIYWGLVQEYIKKEKEYERRFAIVMIVNYFVNPIDKKEIWDIFDKVKKEEYYVSMAVAWAISICYKHNKEQTIAYLKNNKLDNRTYQKVIQKIGELTRTTKEEKIMLRKLKD